MLLKVLKAAAQTLASGRAATASGASSEYPLEVEQKLNRLHGRAPVNRHLEILFDNARVGDENFVERCLLLELS